MGLKEFGPFVGTLPCFGYHARPVIRITQGRVFVRNRFGVGR